MPYSRCAAVDVHYPGSGGANAALVLATAPEFGKDVKPLYVTAAGLSDRDAARLVADMAGEFRLPDVLRRVDRFSRE